MDIKIPTPDELMERRKEKIRPKVESLMQHCLRKLDEEFTGTQIQITHNENEELVIDQVITLFRGNGWHAEKHSETAKNEIVNIIILAPKSMPDGIDLNNTSKPQDITTTSVASKNFRSFG